MSEREIGKIAAIRFGRGGYQDAMIGVSFTLSGKGWGVGDFWGTWNTKITESTEWTEEDRRAQLGEMVMRVDALLKDAQKENLHDLAGVPVEATFENRVLKSWRILTEVI